MSKSLGPQHSIFILEDEGSIREKIKRAVTDSKATIAYDPQRRPAIANLITIFSRVSGMSPRQIEERFSGKGYAEFKTELADKLIQHLRPLRKRYQLLDDKNVAKIFQEGSASARKTAEKTMQMVRKKVGLD